MMKSTLFTITLLNIINSILSLDKCDSFKCVNSLVGNLCMDKDKNTTSLVDLQTCDDNYFCAYNLKAFTGTCQKTDYSTLQFLGGNCNKKSDCIASAEFCDNNTCIRNSTTVCAANTDCAIGNYCNSTAENPSCIPQQAVGGKCLAEGDCINSAGCLNGLCVAYYTLEDGLVVNADNDRFCKSGFALEGTCWSAALVGSGDCSESGICTYNANNTMINSTSACVCGKNYQGMRFCRYGVDADQAKSVLEIKQNYLKALNNTKCHTDERWIPCASKAFDFEGKNTHNNFDYQVTIKNEHNQLIMNSVTFSGIPANDTCILPVLGAYDRNLIKPVSQNACPKYKCESGKIACGISFNPNNWDSSDIIVSLNKGVCASNQTCSTANLKDVYYKESVQLQCDNKIRVANRFPGEKCSSSNQCNNKNCTSENVCKYQKIDESCSSIDMDMGCGLDAFCYLNTTTANSTCVPQKGLNEKCEQTFECKNNLACYNSTCSLEVASKDETFEFNSSLFSPDFKPQYICKSMLYDSNKGKCYTYKYDNMTVNGDGYVECALNDGKECKYINSLNDTLTKGCQCGFNSEGKAYCPIDFSKRKFFFFLNIKIIQ